MAELKPGAQDRQLVLGARSDVGRVRKNNEDNFCALLAPNTPVGVGGILAVADGVGGHQAGERASQMAVEGVTKLLGKKVSISDHAITHKQREHQLNEAIIKINNDIFKASNTVNSRGMGTTLSIAVVVGDSVSIGHVGDSRIYLFRKNNLKQLTPDHSWVAEEVARGAMTNEEASRHPRRNMLTRAVGTQPDVEPSTLSAPLQRDDTLVLCSDGLYGLVNENRIAAVLSAKEPDQAANVLIDMANNAGGTDNVTVVVARIIEIATLPDELWSSTNVPTFTGDDSASSNSPENIPSTVLGRLYRRISRGMRGTG